MMNSKFVLTDSGGMQEEATVLNIPCLTLRDNTERPETIDKGTNILVGNDTQRIVEESFKILRGQGKTGTFPVGMGGLAKELYKHLRNLCKSVLISG
jgi:UDP-N-acetylglucosamine 2-epimerase (non-hydrolysing)